MKKQKYYFIESGNQVELDKRTSANSIKRVGTFPNLKIAQRAAQNASELSRKKVIEKDNKLNSRIVAVKSAVPEINQEVTKVIKVSSTERRELAAKEAIAKTQEVSLKQRLDAKGKEVLVELRNVDVTFGRGATKFKAVNDFSLNVYKGEVLGLVGESGSGKSTTGNAIMGLVNRSAGDIKILGRTIPAVSSKVKGEIRDFIVNKAQMIFQDPANSLNPYKTVEKVIGEGLDNIDVLNAFIKSFDTDTAIGLAKLLKGKPQPPVLAGVTIKDVEKLVNAKKYDEMDKLIYTESRNALRELGTKSALLAARYLEVRSDERIKFLEQGTGKKRIKKKLIMDMLRSVGLSERILQRYPLEFSGGQQQRIGISRAVVLRPSLLIADEPISALDVSIQAQVVNIFNELKSKFNLTIVFIAHDLRMVEYISDRIAVMYKGVLVEVGPASEIAKNPIHPYTKSLLDAVPSIDSKKGSLVGYEYDPSMHDYSETKPGWFKISGDRYVRGTREEIKYWLVKDWSNKRGGK